RRRRGARLQAGRRPLLRARAGVPDQCGGSGDLRPLAGTRDGLGAAGRPQYDSLVAKIIVHGVDRGDAIARMQRALAETLIEGVKTTIPYHQKLLSDPAFVSGEFTLPPLQQSL